MQWNPDLTNSEWNQKIVRYIGGSLNREKTLFKSFRSSHLKRPAMGLFRLSLTSVHILLQKTKLNSNISNGWSLKMKS